MTVRKLEENKYLIRIYIGRNASGQRLEFNTTFDGTEEQANEEETFLKRKAKRGELKPRKTEKLPKSERLKNITFQELYEKYKDSLVLKEESYLATLDRDWNRIKVSLGPRVAREIEKSEITQVLKDLLGENTKEKTDGSQK